VESLGQKLKTARENKSISIDQAGRDTKISIRYLEALERENFATFPGEAYIIGFLRNYGAYLELDVQELLSRYRALLQQQQPMPEQLLKRPSKMPKIVLRAAFALLAVVVVAGMVYLLLTRPRTPRVAVQAVRTAAVHTMSGDSFERHFFSGDAILIPSGDDQIRLELEDIGETVTIRTPDGEVVLDLGQEVDVGLGSEVPNFRITALDFDKLNADVGVRLRFESLEAFAAVPATGTAQPATVSVTSQSSSTVIISSTSNAYPFTLQSAFQGYCMFRWEILMERNRERTERYFQRGDEMNIQAQNGIRIWTSNAQAARFQVIGGGRTYPLEIGGAGEVVVADIRWVRDSDNRFRLVLARLETGS
jgi:cytoskeletal protein RodZ